MPPSWKVDFELEEFTFKFIWNPTYTLRSQVDSQVRFFFDKEWREYLDRIEEQFIKENKAIRSLSVPKQEHFNWLVMYQVKGMSAEEIFASEEPKIYAARKAKGSISDHTKYIRKAYNKLARFIYLPLRKDGTSPGRKPRKKS